MAILSKLMVKALHKFKKLVYYKKNKPKRTESTGKGKDSTPQMLSEAVVSYCETVLYNKHINNLCEYLHDI